MEVSVLYRFAIASVILFGMMAIKRIPFRYSLRQHIHMALLGTLLFSTNFVFIYHAAPYVPSGLLAIIFSTSAIMIMINNIVFFKKPANGRMLLGALLGISGLCCVFLPELRHFDFNSGISLGLIYGFTGTYAFALANHVSGRCQTQKIPLIASTGYGMAYGVLFLTLICWVKGISFAYDFSMHYNVALLYLAIPGSVVGFLTYLTLVQRLGAERAVYTTLLFPLVALLISTFFESFVWTKEDYVGVMMILAGNALVMAPKGAFIALINKLFKAQAS